MFAPAKVVWFFVVFSFLEEQEKNVWGGERAKAIEEASHNSHFQQQEWEAVHFKSPWFSPVKMAIVYQKVPRISATATQAKTAAGLRMVPMILKLQGINSHKFHTKQTTAVWL